MSGKNDIYVSPTQIRRFNLKTGDEIVGDCRPSQDEDKFSPLLFVKTINGDPLEIALKRRPFERLTPIYPKEKISLDTGDRTRTASRLIDLIAPIGKGQRGMIVAPPKAGKTTILKQIAQFHITRTLKFFKNNIIHSAARFNKCRCQNCKTSALFYITSRTEKLFRLIQCVRIKTAGQSSSCRLNCQVICSCKSCD